MTTISENPIVREAVPSDAHSVADIYNHYIGNTAITFEEEPVNAPEMAQRISAVQSASLPWLIAISASVVVGYAYATPWKSRSAYRFSVETTVYLAPEHTSKGVGTVLYGRLLDILRARNIHCAMGGIALPNASSVALHEKFGFRNVARFHEVGFKFDQWIDVGYWQKNF